MLMEGVTAGGGGGGCVFSPQNIERIRPVMEEKAE
jgi:hypothetical protein